MRDDFQQQVFDLRRLGEEGPTADSRRKLDAALDSKFEGIQTVALDVLGLWGDLDSIKSLRSAVRRAFSRPTAWALRTVAVRSIIPHLTESDVQWVLDLYFGLPDVSTKHEALKLVTALPTEAARTRLIAELSSRDPANRQAAVKAIGNMAYPDRRQIIRPLCEDSDDFVRESATLLSRGE